VKKTQPQNEHRAGKKGPVCFACNQPGHRKNECPYAEAVQDAIKKVDAAKTVPKSEAVQEEPQDEQKTIEIKRTAKADQKKSAESGKKAKIYGLVVRIEALDEDLADATVGSDVKHSGAMCADAERVQAVVDEVAEVSAIGVKHGLDCNDATVGSDVKHSAWTGVTQVARVEEIIGEASEVPEIDDEITLNRDAIYYIDGR